MVFGQEKLGWFRESPTVSLLSYSVARSTFADLLPLAVFPTVPIPARPSMDDGLHYVPNPRFSPEGYWRERRFWPAELR